jgi:hypothetical protein
VAASGFAGLLACLETSFYSESPPSESGRKDWQWHPVDGEWASGKTAYAVGEATLVDELPAS